MSPEEWYRSLPLITKIYFTTAVATTCLTSFGVLSPQLLYLNFELVFKKFQIWRLLTCFIFFGPFGMPFVFNIFILVRHFNMLESEYFNRGSAGTADLVFMCLFGMTIMIVVAYFYEGLVFIGSALVFMTIYVWSRKDPHRPVNFWGFSFDAWHFPFVLLVVGLIMNSNIVLDILGIAVGHLYHFLMDIVPLKFTSGRPVLYTPQWLYNVFETRTISGRPQQAWHRGGGQRLG